ncbi:hypothetical protein F383_06288 [Gossypium arboreum]|uniref:Uncharacterized protein n=1 Tax=Gossypium arboreum TaxID=29729 RepID=A0A0B0PGX6_GOSAR|nr:hypothetical protein F383_06288 [Gossypium arboreum]
MTMYNHVERVQYRQASLRIKGRRRLVHTIDWIFWVLKIYSEAFLKLTIITMKASIPIEQ